MTSLGGQIPNGSAYYGMQARTGMEQSAMSPPPAGPLLAGMSVGLPTSPSFQHAQQQQPFGVGPTQFGTASPQQGMGQMGQQQTPPGGFSGYPHPAMQQQHSMNTPFGMGQRPTVGKLF